jgi:zinc/manganese transport system permease protein
VAGFPSAAPATYLGLAAPLGYFGFCIVGVLVIAALPGAGQANSELGGYGEESAVIGTVQGFALGCGFLFVSLYQGFVNGLNNLPFGSIVGLTDGQVLTLLVADAACLAVLAVICRPLLFATADPDVARARGMPVRAVGALFLVVLGVASARTSQMTGSLLVFALLVTPAATVARLTARPAAGVALSVVIAVAVT